jgi:hypothetical protein
MRPHLNRKTLCVVVHAYYLKYSGKHKIGGSWSTIAHARGMAEAVQDLPLKHEALGSNFSTGSQKGKNVVIHWLDSC